MNPSLGAWDIFHLLGAAQGFFLAIVFSFHKRGNPLANRFLGLLLFIFSLKLLEIVAFWSKYLLVFPHMSLISFPFSYLIGVVFFSIASIWQPAGENLTKDSGCTPFRSSWMEVSFQSDSLGLIRAIGQFERYLQNQELEYLARYYMAFGKWQSVLLS